MLPSTYNKIKTKTYVKILRHYSLEMGINRIYRRFQVLKRYNKRYINVKKLLMKNAYFLHSWHSYIAFSVSIPILNISVERVYNLVFIDTK